MRKTRTVLAPVVLSAAMPGLALAQNYRVSTLPGLTAVTSGNVDGTGTSARFDKPAGLCTDAAGDVYVADFNNQTIRKVTPARMVTTLAGLPGTPGVVDGTGTAARFRFPRDVGCDRSSGLLYVGQSGNAARSGVLRRVTSTGEVTTLAGNPSVTGHADGTGTAALLGGIGGVAVDSFGNVFITDVDNNTIRKVTPAGTVTTFAGRPGIVGFGDGNGAQASFYWPWGIAIDASNTLYVSDAGGHRIRRITPAADVTTIAGSSGGNSDGTGTGARFNHPTDLAVDAAGDLYIADTFNAIVRRMTPAGVVTTLPGGAIPGLTTQNYAGTEGVTIDSTGNVIVAVTLGHALFTIAPGLPGTVFAGPPFSARPIGVARDEAGVVYAVDNRHVIWKVLADGSFSAMAGLLGAPGNSDGSGSAARFNTPRGIAIDAAGNLYVADTLNEAIRKVTPFGDVTTIAGGVGQGFVDGGGGAARFYNPSGVAVDLGGNLYVADTGNKAIRKISPAGQVSTLASGGPLNGSWGVAVDAVGVVYVADTGTNSIWVLPPSGAVTLLAGAGEPGYTGGWVDGTGSAARFSEPTGLTVDSSGNVFVADRQTSTIRRVTPGGEVTTIAGNGLGVWQPLADGLGSAARFASPSGITLGSDGRLYVADINHGSLRLLTPIAGLSIGKAGTAGGRVVTSPAGIDCGTDCTEDFDLGSTVTLTAIAHSQFNGWSGGDCTGTGPCTVTMDGAKTVTASFGWKPAAASVCPSGCTHGTIQAAINGSQPGDTVLVRSTYDATAAGEVFPVTTQAIRAINPAGAIRLLGEVNASGQPTSTVAVRGGPSDGILMLNAGAVENLRIVGGDALPVQRALTARTGNACPGATCDLTGGLTIRNVVVDFGASFNASFGLHLQADQALVDRVTVKGTAGTALTLDGDDVTVQDSTLDGRDGSAIRGALAIRFGAEQKFNGVDCAWAPKNTWIRANTITGFVDGIRWCTGQFTRIESNTFTNLSGRMIDTSGSQFSLITGNVLTETSTGGAVGISLAANGYQFCRDNRIAQNKVLGREAKDLQRGIQVQGCLDTEVLFNEVRNLNGNAIEVSAPETSTVPTQSTRNVIQGNTVIGGYAAGIVYTGADSAVISGDRSHIRDNVVTDQGRDGILVRFMRGFRSGTGAGNIVAYNTVRRNNLSGAGDAHGITLRDLSRTAFDRNTALDTQGPGAGFFLGDSAAVSGNCNTGTANGGGLFLQQGVTPTYGNVNVNCRLALYTHNDFDGDGRSDMAVYRHTTGDWFVRRSSTGVVAPAVPWGSPALDDIPAPGAYTQAGTTDVAIYRYSSGDWVIRRSTDGTANTIRFGEPAVGDLPVPADYDGDGLTDLATFRVSTANAEWRIRQSSNGQVVYVPWGCAACADLAVPADYDGDGKADVAVYRRSTGEWYVRRSSDASTLQVLWGSPVFGDLPVPGRYSTPGKADLAVYRSLTADWLIRRATDSALTQIRFGTVSRGDFPAPADYTVAGTTDLAVYIPTTSAPGFSVRRSNDGGTTGVALGNAAALDAPLTSR